MLAKPLWFFPPHTLHSVPAAFNDWFSDTGSMTERLSSVANLKVQVLTQGVGSIFKDEAIRLNQPALQNSFIREVYLLCDNVPWMFARTVVPYPSLTGAFAFIRTLGAHPLGRILFRNHHLKRSAFEISKNFPQHYFYQKSVQDTPIYSKPKFIWARRSMLSVKEQSLLLTEAFTPYFYAAMGNPSNMQGCDSCINWGVSQC